MWLPKVKTKSLLASFKRESGRSTTTQGFRRHQTRTPHRPGQSDFIRFLNWLVRDIRMTDALRITVDELRKRMESGEDFVLIDTRNPQQWEKSEVKMPEAIRVPLDNLDDFVSTIPTEKPIVTYCT
jgi:hypothetical protein